MPTGLADFLGGSSLKSTTTRSGQITANYLPDGTIDSTSGAITQLTQFGGAGTAQFDSTADSARGFGANDAGSSGSSGSVLERADRDIDLDMSGFLSGTKTVTTTAGVGTDADGNPVLDLDTSDPVVDGTVGGWKTVSDIRSVWNIFNGSVTAQRGDQGQLIGFQESDSGESFPGTSSSVDILLAPTDFGIDQPFVANAIDSPDADLSRFARTLDYRGEASYGPSFSTALPGTPEANSLGPDDFLGNLTNEAYFMQGAQDGEDEDGYFPPLGEPFTAQNTRAALTAMVGHGDPFLLGWLQEANTARIELRNGWFGQSDAWYDPETNTIVINTDYYDSNEEAAAAAYKVLIKNARYFENLAMSEEDSFRIRRQNAFDNGAKSAEDLQTLVQTYASVLDVADFGLALDSLMDKDVPVRTKVFIAVLAALPVVQGQMAKPASRIADDLFDSSGQLVGGKLDELVQLSRAPIGGAGGTFDSATDLVRGGTRRVLSQGTDPTCGAYSCAMVVETMGRWGLPDDIVTIARQNGWLTNTGMLRGDIPKLLKKFGIRAEEVTGSSIDALRAATRGGHPAIVRYGSGNGHFVVVDGVTRRMGKDVIAIRDPLGAKLFKTVDEFLELWDRSFIQILD